MCRRVWLRSSRSAWRRTPGDRYASYAALGRGARAVPHRPRSRRRRLAAGSLPASSIRTSPRCLPCRSTCTSGAVVDARESRPSLLLAQCRRGRHLLAYYTILEGRFGCGAGKAVFNLRVVDERRPRPDTAARSSARRVHGAGADREHGVRLSGVAAGRAPAGSTGALAADPGGLVSIVLALSVLATMFSTARQRNGYAALHDLATGTRVVLRPRAVEARQARAADRGEAATPLGAEGARIGPYVVAPAMKVQAAAPRRPSCTAMTIGCAAACGSSCFRSARRRCRRCGAISAGPRGHAG